VINLPAPLNVVVSDIHRPCFSIEGDLRKYQGRHLFNWGNDFASGTDIERYEKELEKQMDES
jgi:hypothetical protein